TVHALFIWSQTYDGLPLRGEELGRDGRGLLQGNRVDLREHVAQRAVGVVVKHEPGKPMHPGPGTLERQHDLALELPLAVIELRRGQALPCEAVVLLPDRLDRLVGRGRLGSDVDTELAGALKKLLEGKDRVGKAQLLPDALEQAARHAATKRVHQNPE